MAQRGFYKKMIEKVMYAVIVGLCFSYLGHTLGYTSGFKDAEMGLPFDPKFSKSIRRGL